MIVRTKGLSQTTVIGGEIWIEVTARPIRTPGTQKIKWLIK